MTNTGTVPMPPVSVSATDWMQFKGGAPLPGAPPPFSYAMAVGLGGASPRPADSTPLAAGTEIPGGTPPGGSVDADFRISLEELDALGADLVSRSHVRRQLPLAPRDGLPGRGGASAAGPRAGRPRAGRGAVPGAKGGQGRGMPGIRGSGPPRAPRPAPGPSRRPAPRRAAPAPAGGPSPARPPAGRPCAPPRARSRNRFAS